MAVEFFAVTGQCRVGKAYSQQTIPVAGKATSHYTPCVMASLPRQRSWKMSLRLLSLEVALTWVCLVSTSVSVLASEYRAGRILIMPGKAATPAALTKFHSAHGATIISHFSGMGGLEILSVPSDVAVERLVAEYQRSGLVEFAQPDYLYHTAATFPNDPKFADGTLWALYNYGQNGGTPHADIDAPDAWDILTSASNIIVAVLDTGVRYTHEDLATNMWVNPNDGSHGLNTIATNTDPADDEGHGTQVAGVLGAAGNNGKGVVGVAWQVQIMACKCLDSSGNASDSTIIPCIDYARTNGARIINASWGSYTFSPALSNAVLSARNAGIILVAAAGNDFRSIDATPYYPACLALDNVVSVAYATRNDTLGSLSNFGATNVALAAPGAAMCSTFYSSDSSYLCGSFLQGTSYSAPYVSGALALMLAKFPAEPHQQIISRLLNAVDPVPALAGKCATGGRLNLRNALNPPIRLKAVSSPAGPFQLRLSAAPNFACTIQISTNLSAWSPIFTNTTSTNGTFAFTDYGSTNVVQRFYRAVSAP